MSASSAIRHASLWLSFIHAVVVLILVPIAMFGQAWRVGSVELWNDDSKWDSLSYKEQLWSMAELLMRTEPTDLHRFISGFAGVYYTIDLALIVSTPPHTAAAHARTLPAYD